jgi:hypothetical protein
MVEVIFLLENVKYFSENKSYIINFQEKSFFYDIVGQQLQVMI